MIDAKGQIQAENNNEDSNSNVNLHYEPRDIAIYADKDRISQVVYNLLSNAIKFTKRDSGGEIYLTTEKDNNNSSLIVTVKDTGTGIDLEIMPRLFTKFATKSDRGTGLGLFLSKNIVEAHGGRFGQRITIAHMEMELRLHLFFHCQWKNQEDDGKNIFSISTIRSVSFIGFLIKHLTS